MAVRDLSDETALFNRIERVSASMASYTPDPGVADRAAGNYSRYPWMTPGVVLSLAEAGHGPDDDLTAAAADLEAKQKRKRGFGWHSIGDAVSAAGGLGSDVVNVIGETAGDLTRPVVRTAFTALETPLQEVKALMQAGLATGLGEGGFVENLKRSAFGESTGLQAFEQLIKTGAPGGEKLDVDLGSGFFSGGKIRETYQEESSKLRYKGQSITLGRVFADAVFEPGSKPYNLLSGLVDAGVELGLDPATYATAGLSKVSKARRVFALEDATGLVDGTRRTILSETAAEWLASPKGRRVVEAIAEEGDVDRLWRMLGKKPEVDTLVQLTDADNADDVRKILEPKLGIEAAWREKPRLIAQESLKTSAFETVFRRSPRDVRVFGDVPANKLDFSRPEEALKTFDDWQLNARVPEQIRAANNADFARALVGGSGVAKYDAVVKKGAKAVKDSLLAHGADESVADDLTRLFVDSHSDSVKYLIDDAGKELSFHKVVVNGEPQDLPAPFWLAQTLGNVVDLPDARAVRRATSNPVIQKAIMNRYGDMRVPVEWLDRLQQDLWKPLTLIRGAWPVRVIGEEQVRMGAVGLNSAFNHPISYLAWVVGSESKTGARLAKLGVKTGRGELGVKGQHFADEAAFSRLIGDADEFASGMNRRATNWSGRDPAKKLRIDDWHVYDRADSDYLMWWEDSLLRVNSDPVAQRIAGGLRTGDKAPTNRAGLDAVKSWFYDGTGRKFRHQLEEIHPNLANRADANAYIDQGWTELQRLTAGDADLLDAIASPELRRMAMGEGISGRRSVLGERLSDLRDQAIGPQKVTGQKTASKGADANRVKEFKDKAVDNLFAATMGIPSDKLSRSPTFRQLYWKRVEEVFPKLTRDAQRDAVDAAINAGLSRKQVDAIKRRALAGAGDVDIDDLDLVAKKHALEGTRSLLYDLHRRNQFFDAARLVFPFGEAWKEVVGTWAKIGVQHPKAIRRAQQLIEGGRGGDTDPNTGFFRTNEFGEEVFTYPFSGAVMGGLTGVPFPLEGRVQGLNLMAQTIPGFGPAISMPVGWLTRNKPEWQFVRDVVLPFGERETSSGFVESFLPAWMQKFRQSFGEPADLRQFGNTVMDVQRWLSATGEYPADTPEEVARLHRDATAKAKAVYAIRGAAQFFAPSAPTVRALTIDKSGEHVFAAGLVEEYAAMQDEDYRTATARFLEKFGMQAAMVMQSKTQRISYGPITTEGLKWAQEHSGLRDVLPHTYGLFAPQGGEFDSKAYAALIDAGALDPLEPRQAILLSNQRKANLIYHQAQDQLAGRNDEAGRAWLRGIREALIQKYPGFGDEVVLKQNTDSLIRELAHAATLPELARTEAGQGLRLYLTAREKAMQAVGGPFQRSQAARPVRDWLRKAGDLISQVHPDFAPMFDQVFNREMADDVTEVAG